MKEPLTLERLHEVLHYDLLTGLFTWLVRRGSKKAGTVAGYKTTFGYVYILIDGERHLAHRLAWYYVNGRWPERLLDHRDNVRHNNVMDNLREANHSQNAQNQPPSRKNNKSGLLGVSWCRKVGRWQAQIKVNGKSTFLGYFDTPEQAHEAYLIEKQKLHPFAPRLK